MDTHPYLMKTYNGNDHYHVILKMWLSMGKNINSDEDPLLVRKKCIAEA